MAEPATRTRIAAGLALVFLLALAMRALGFEQVFTGDLVVFAPGDAMYHLRRALFTFSRFPAVLLWDPYINHPGGAPVAWPPLFDFMLGSAARLLARDEAGFEVVAAWAPPVLGALTTLPVFLAARRVASPAVALGAGAFFALLPASIHYGRVGNPDHHVAVALLGACLLALCLALVERSREGGIPWGLTAGLTLARVALMLTWHGSLLYLVLVEATLLVTAALTGRRVLYAVEALSSAATWVVLAPVLAASPEPLGGLYSSIALSRLHMIALALVALVAGSLWLLEGTRPGRTPLARLLRLAGCGLFFVALVFALPGPREGLVPALRFLTLSDEAGARTGEQFPLLPLFGREVPRSAHHTWGLYVYWIPLLPAALLFALRGDRERRPVHWALAAWCAAFGLLALLQRRYGNDLAPAFSVAIAVVLARLVGGSASRMGLASSMADRWAGALAVVLGLLLFAPSLASYQLPRARSSLAALRGDPRIEAAAARSAAASLTRFALALRRATPETSGFFEPDETPEYGVIAHANLGHALQYLGRRATATDPFWAYIGPENWERSFAFLAATEEAEARVLANQLNGRFVVTTAAAAPGSVVHQLHWYDGNSREGRRRIEGFRLIDESSRDGHGLGEIFAPRTDAAPAVPYKLYEVVKGAVIESRAAPGSEAVARLELRSPMGREFVYSASTRADAEGRVRLRVPYASEGQAPVTAAAPWHVRIDGRWHRVSISEPQVRRGRTVHVGR
ncbi:MAG: hypothetical protein JRG96_12660 [Deltaproteobacteria bacterium]|nr:hypothetical protein [Deltaproteobacteria bacterium]